MSDAGECVWFKADADCMWLVSPENQELSVLVHSILTVLPHIHLWHQKVKSWHAINYTMILLNYKILQRKNTKVGVDFFGIFNLVLQAWAPLPPVPSVDNPWPSSMCMCVRHVGVLLDGLSQQIVTSCNWSLHWVGAFGLIVLAHACRKQLLAFVSVTKAFWCTLEKKVEWTEIEKKTETQTDPFSCLSFAGVCHGQLE